MAMGVCRKGAAVTDHDALPDVGDVLVVEPASVEGGAGLAGQGERGPLQVHVLQVHELVHLQQLTQTATRQREAGLFGERTAGTYDLLAHWAAEEQQRPAPLAPPLTRVGPHPATPPPPTSQRSSSP